MSAVISLAFAQEKEIPAALASLVESERAFARTSVEKGVREAFLAYFADDGINFQPHPVNTKEAFRSRPAPANPRAVTLDWEPIFADVSAACDLGYTTGPYSLTDNTPEKRLTQHGYFFSIWKKQSDGSWKVALDVGIQTPAPDAASPKPVFRAASQVAPKKTSRSPQGDAREALLNLDREFAKEVQLHGLASALASYLAMNDDTRVHRNGMFPLVGRKAIESYLAGLKTTMTWEPMKADVAQSADLGYTYGSYEWKAGSSTPAEKGYYVRVWKRNAAGQWKVVLDTLNPLPPGIELSGSRIGYAWDA